MLKIRKKLLMLAVSVCLVIAAIPTQSFAAVTSGGSPSKTETLISSEHPSHNFVQVTAKDSTVTINCETPIYASEFNINIRGVEPASTKSTWIHRVYPVNNGDYYSFNTSFSTMGLSGSYVLIITMKKDASADSVVFYKNACFNVSDGNTSLLQYNKIINANRSMQITGLAYPASKYTDKKLSDIQTLVFKNPKTGKIASVTTAKVNYFKKVAEIITADASSDYEKILKIYEYIAENFYYDNLAFSKKQYQYVDPYLNLKNLRNKTASANSTSDGKVATTCVGYAASVVALARAIDLPAQMVNGHHIELSTTYNNWSTEQNISAIDHWWVEVYADGRWIVVDPTPGNSNKWKRTSFSSKGTWEYSGLTNYIYFDPSVEQLSTSHITFEIKPYAYKVSKLDLGDSIIKSSSSKAGKFTFTYDMNKSKTLKVCAKPNSGYKFVGIYNPEGKRLSSSSTYSFKPGEGTYIVKFSKI